MRGIRAAIYRALEADQPMTVRQVFYRLTSEGVISKSESEYNRTVVRLLGEMRRDGTIPYEWLADATRWMRKPTTFNSVEEALQNTAQAYRRDLWSDGDEYVELWLEKEALAGVLVDVTNPWDVPLMVTRGYSSISYLHSAAQTIRGRAKQGKHTTIYYFGDRDPSGVDIDRAIRQGIGESLISLTSPFSADAWEKEEVFRLYASFERVAVTEEQIAEWDLQTRPTKKSDTRSKSFEGVSVELDAIPPAELRQLAEETINRHVDWKRLKVLLVAEEEERKGLEQIAALTGDDGGYAWAGDAMQNGKAA
jgi:hypothetical protein